MTPEDLRADMPALDGCTYLNTGASGPSPRRVVDAAREFTEHFEYEAARGEGMYPAAFDAIEETRETVADYLCADASEVALTQSTTDGIHRIAGAIDWEPGDVVVRTDLEHSAGILPWKRLADVADIEVRVLETDDGRIPVDEYADAVADARLVCFSALTWSHGTCAPVADLVEIARDAGCLSLVDAVQNVGQLSVDLHAWDADFVACAGHKWLLGPFGSGMLYVREGSEDELVPRAVGYRGVEDANAESYELAPGAARMEVGTVNPAEYVALREAIEVNEEIGMDTITGRIEELTDRLKAGLPDGSLVSPREYESGLVTFEVGDPEASVERLAEANVRIRSLPYPGVVRASLHVFNTPEDVDRLLAELS